MPQELLKKPPKLAHGPRTKPSVLNPSFMRNVIEGLIDTGMGATGFGNDSKMSGIGELLAASVPVLGGVKKLGKVATAGRYDAAKLKASDFPIQNRLAMGMTPNKGLYDDMGRYVGPAPKADPMFETHVASSVGKRTQDALIGRKSNYGPSDDQYEKLIKKHGGQKK